MPELNAISVQLSTFAGRLLTRAGGHPHFEFHIHAAVREKYQFDQSLFTTSGNAIFTNFNAARVFARKMNDKRNLVNHPGQAVRAGHLNAMGLIDEILHYVLRLYEETANPNVFSRALAHLNQRLGKEEIGNTLSLFGTLFPPLDVYLGKESLDKFLKRQSGGKAHTEMALEEMVLLYIANANPALSMYAELFDDRGLIEESEYRASIETLDSFFQSEKPFGPDNQLIFDLLRAPMRASPHSLEGQLEFMRKHWGLLISDKFLRRILTAGDFIKEDMRIIVPGGAAQTLVPVYPRGGAAGSAEYGSFEAERFTRDLDWMPRVVILAKNTYVWLHQLSMKYRRSIARLDEIPDEELDQLARWNFTGLWLIGLWERSPASQKLKQMMGNPEAVSSAYSIYDYEIAADLGGEHAFHNLRDRAWHRGIRLAGDMVPNHMGVYSKWVVEHPEYFIQSGHSPFPNYSFTGADLSGNPALSIRIEDGYWTRRDAAVVFQRVDHSSGNLRYVYHGNDGTSMPWNDTAQLDFIKAEVREAVIQTIFHVARKFSIIRFDAAMTLTKKHFQRLWYPQPGTGGDIPSRADHAMTLEEFDSLFPNEFWREVVDRINAEMPNTLLLAEAFWLLEGYFVRTLGMHRVYNSAFMHMLTREENSKYRELIRNTLQYNPEILKRYVNFMSNPDEQTAIAQFGKEDKYFGVAVMMVTLPGLPMFGHGQIDGFTEKYGMEYKRAYYDEMPDEHLIRRHEREIFPIMKRRHLFSQVQHFELYDLVDNHGHVNENVFAYSNMSGGERALICYHNKYEETSGWIRMSVGKTVSGESESIVRKNLAEALALNTDEKRYYIFRDYKSALEFIRSGRELRDQGLFVDLKAFQYRIFLDFSEVYDSTGDYERLAHRLAGRGVPDMSREFRQMRLSPAHEAFSALFEPALFDRIVEYCSTPSLKEEKRNRILNEMTEQYMRFRRAAALFLKSSADESTAAGEVRNLLAAARWVIECAQSGGPKMTKPGKSPSQRKPGIPQLLKPGSGDRRETALILAWIVCNRLSELKPAEGVGDRRDDVYGELLLDEVFAGILHAVGMSHEEERQDVDLLRILIRCEGIFSAALVADHEPMESVRRLLDDTRVQHFIRLNVYNGIQYYNKELFEIAVDWMVSLAAIRQSSIQAQQRPVRVVQDALKILQRIKALSEKSGFQFETLQKSLAEPGIDKAKV